MSTLIRLYPGDRALEFLLVVTLGVALASSAAWLISRRLAGKAAQRHLVLFSALICCLASPVLAWLCAAAGLKFVSVPILPGQTTIVSRPAQIEPDPAGMRSPQRTNTPPAAAGFPLPSTGTQARTDTNTTSDPSRVVTAAPAANPIPAMLSPSQSDMQRTGGPAEALLVSLRGIAAGAMFAWAAGVLLMLARLARNCRRA